jgi:dihydrofolate reductase
MKLGIIFACDEDGGIGKDGKMPWHFPGDLQQFKEQTMGQPMIMGRKTWESFGGRMLPGRPHIVVTSAPGESFVVPSIRRGENFFVAKSLEEAIQIATVICESTQKEWAWVIGGVRLIQDARMRAQKIRVTHIHDVFDCDAKVHPSFFHHIMVNRLEWKTVAEHERYNVTEYLM